MASSADVPVAVRIADSVPAHIDGSDVGFHTGCAGTDWSYLDGRVWFTPTLETGEQVETVFAVRDPDEETVSSLTDSPTIEAVQPLE